tara:strand:- start:376 stop:501 length:126 start_codon:yes stop_codon:yes gene_type:complete
MAKKKAEKTVKVPEEKVIKEAPKAPKVTRGEWTNRGKPTNA